MIPVYQYQRVKVYPGKHGPGDYRVEIARIAPTHLEMLAMLWWFFEAENRYKGRNGYGDTFTWLNFRRTYDKDVPLDVILRDAA